MCETHLNKQSYKVKMEKHIKEKFNNTILQQAMRRYNIAKDDITLLAGFESFIYEFKQNNKAYILRIGHSHRRNINLISGEVDWINYLAQGGAAVAKAMLSADKNLVEAIDDGHGGQFLATAFKKAKGKPPSKTMWTADFFKVYGQVIGKIHALTKNYTPTHSTWYRPHWNDPTMLEVEKLLPPTESIAIEKYQQLIEYLQRLSQNKETYGLVHQDAHGGNFFVDETGHITLFDFDDCAYTWFINDIAIVLFYAVLGQQDEAAFTKEFMTHFLQGYFRENTLDMAWLEQIPYFLKLREIDLYAVIHRSFDVNNLDDNPWCKRYMHNRKTKIENDIPFIEFDFKLLPKIIKG